MKHQEKYVFKDKKKDKKNQLNFRGSKTAAGTTLLFSSLAFRNALKTQSNM